MLRYASALLSVLLSVCAYNNLPSSYGVFFGNNHFGGANKGLFESNLPSSFGYDLGFGSSGGQKYVSLQKFPQKSHVSFAPVLTSVLEELKDMPGSIKDLPVLDKVSQVKDKEAPPVSARPQCPNNPKTRVSKDAVHPQPDARKTATDPTTELAIIYATQSWEPPTPPTIVSSPQNTEMVRNPPSNL